MLFKTTLALAPSLVASTTLYAASYSGLVTTLDLTLSDDGTASLAAVGESDGCGASPSWLEIAEDGLIYCSDEGLSSTKGSVSALERGSEGLQLVGSLDTEQGPVSSARFGGEGLVVSH